ncbi:hypothetical protein GCM10009801_36860 [Streptomyces albiaxialis]|uniref:Uncharacterized protein n=1 Tax=Streptomyces albiaxialis TaxID=329523 RepID=A0ABP5HJR1_9ACTN
MGLFDKLTGTMRPAAGTEPRPIDDVLDALLELNGPDVPYLVREGTVAEGADLVAEWRIEDPAWHTFFARRQLTRTLRTRMRLVPERHEVRALDEQWKVTWVGDTPRLSRTREYGRGPSTTISREWTIGRGASGRLEATEVHRFDSREMRDPLRNTVLDAGWAWRGVILGL